jgi:hypothetical protein
MYTPVTFPDELTTPADSVPPVVKLVAVTLFRTFSVEFTLPATLRLPDTLRLAPVMLPAAEIILAVTVFVDNAFADSEVNAPVDGVTLPMGILLIAPDDAICQPDPFQIHVLPPKL